MKQNFVLANLLIIFYAFLFLLIPFLNAQVTAEDGDWSNKFETIQNSPEADLMVRTGDIDNLGFGWPNGFNPFSGNSTPAHGYPWTADSTDPSGTDRIMVLTSYSGYPPYGQDGYTAYTSRPENSVRPIMLTYSLNDLNVQSAILQLFVDDFQAGLWGASYQVTINDVRIYFLETIINSLMQTGPIGKLISVEIPADYLYLLEKDTLRIVFDDFTTGAGDGYAIDFIKLLVNPQAIAQVGTINGTVYDQDNYQPLESVRIVANGSVEDTTDVNGNYTLNEVTAGIVSIQSFKEGYGSQNVTRELIAGGSITADFYLQSPAPVVTSVDPSDNSFEVDLNAVISVKFDQAMDTLTFTNAHFILSAADSSVKGSFIRSDSLLIFIPSALLVDDTEYRAELTTGVKNSVGVALASSFVWKFSTGLPVNIQDTFKPAPDKLILKQNYPNPFNPFTRIQYELSTPAQVQIDLYNNVGQKISTLLNQFKTAGMHQLYFNGSNLPAGIYYYRLKAAQTEQVKKMILLK